MPKKTKIIFDKIIENKIYFEMKFSYNARLAALLINDLEKTQPSWALLLSSFFERKPFHQSEPIKSKNIF